MDGKWVANTNFQEQIKSIDYHKAIQRVGPHNSIAALTHHINYYLVGIIQVFEGGPLDIRDKYSFDMPPMSTEEHWQKLVDDFCSNSKKFVDHVANMDESQFSQPFVDQKYGDYLRNIDGVIEHTYYHLGQIAMLQKILQNH
jgi:hypothetical protein